MFWDDWPVMDRVVAICALVALLALLTILGTIAKK
jgi:hypothetical protein